jgi:flagellar basal body-associated protein FliL
MEQTPDKKTSRTLLTVLIVLIVLIALLVGAFFTCVCTCRKCVNCARCGFETCGEWAEQRKETQTPADTAAPATPGPAATKPAATEPPHTEASDLVREKRVRLKNDGTDTVTVLILMNGSDLESEAGEATEDLTEMVRAKKSGRVNILVETVGTRRWEKRYGISAKHAQRYLVTDRGLTLVDDSLGQLDTTVPSTLSDFIRWGAGNYPADRYILILWDHGGGAVYGFGYDEYQPYESTLTIDEMQLALKNGGVYFDLIGMDCCLMSSLEVCCALYDYCDYTLLSEDFEPGCGWSHTGWLTALADDPAIPTERLASIVIDDTVAVCEKDLARNGGATLALIDEAYIALLYPAWVDFAYDSEEALLNRNYSQLRSSAGGRVHPMLRSVGGWYTGGNGSLDDYGVTDILSVAMNVPSDKSEALCAAFDAAVVKFGATSDETTLTGLSVTLPYGDEAFYNELRRVFRNAGIDETYIDWLGKFTAVETGYYDFGDAYEWEGWNTYYGDYDWGGWDLGWVEDAADWLFGGIW